MGIVPGLDRIDLTDAQREQIRAMLDEEREQAQAGHPGEKMRQAEQALRAAIFADVADAAAIDAAKTAMSAAHTAELDHRIALMQKIGQILTAAQRQQMAQPPPGPPGRGKG